MTFYWIFYYFYSPNQKAMKELIIIKEEIKRIKFVGAHVILAKPGYDPKDAVSMIDNRICMLVWLIDRETIKNDLKLADCTELAQVYQSEFIHVNSVAILSIERFASVSIAQEMVGIINDYIEVLVKRESLK